MELSEGRKVNIWTESKYAFGVVHAHGAIWKERGLLSAQGTEIKRAAQIQELLQSIQKPMAVAIMHCKAHQTGKKPPEIGNQLAHEAAKEAAETGIMALLPEKEITLPETPPKYDSKDANNKSLTGTRTNRWVGCHTHRANNNPTLISERNC